MSVEVFRSHLSIEAEIVRGLLEAHGLDARVSSTLAPGLFPLRFGGQAEFRVSVRKANAERAASVIAGHLDEAAAVEVRRLSEIVEPLEKRIGYHFRDLGLLEHALTHRSRAHEDASGGVMDNESLEFLGDAVLGFVIADMLFQRFPTHSEGYKSKIKASIVSTVSLAKLALTIDLGRYVLLGRGEEKTGGRAKNAILADSFEALIAAVYLDGGVDAARAFIGACFDPLIDSGGDRVAQASFTDDWKSELQEWLQAAGRGLPVYQLTDTDGPDHRRLFNVDVMVEGVSAGHAQGRSKKEAEQQAAKAALTLLRTSGPQDQRTPGPEGS